MPEARRPGRKQESIAPAIFLSELSYAAEPTAPTGNLTLLELHYEEVFCQQFAQLDTQARARAASHPAKPSTCRALRLAWRAHQPQPRRCPPDKRPRAARFPCKNDADGCSHAGRSR